MVEYKSIDHENVPGTPLCGQIKDAMLCHNHWWILPSPNLCLIILQSNDGRISEQKYDNCDRLVMLTFILNKNQWYLNK